jgi:hypothetical protein
MFNNIDINTHTYCISINNKRYEYLCKNFNSVGLKCPTLFRGVRWNRGSNTGCVLSHMALLRMCKYLKLPYCIIYEDDAYPRPDVLDVWETVKVKVPNDCGLLKLGSSSYRGNLIEIDDCFYQMKDGAAYGSHAYIIRYEMYDIVCNYMCEQNIPEAFLNLENFKDYQYKPYCLNFDNLMFIQKNINLDNIISNKGGERYWYPHKTKHVGCTSSRPCENFVDCLIKEECDYIESICIIEWDKFRKGKKTGVVTDNLLYTKDESGDIYHTMDGMYIIWHKTGERNNLVFNKQINDIKYYTIT